MVPRPPRPDQQPGTVTVTLEIDFTTGSTRNHVDEVGALSNPRLRGKTIALKVGRTDPLDLTDNRILPLLCEALANGVNLHLVGAHRAVDAWSELLYPPYPPPAPRGRERVPRHLEVVNG